mgnify:CR=1 FL=1
MFCLGWHEFLNTEPFYSPILVEAEKAVEVARTALRNFVSSLG